MQRRLLSILGGVSALALLSGAALAAPTVDAPATVKPAQSFGELLDPVPDAVSVLKADDGINAARPVQVAQLYFGVGHHHHHHHNFYYHHHHHFRGGYPGFGFYRHHHHHHFYHHHHHHHHFYGY